MSIGFGSMRLPEITPGQLLAGPYLTQQNNMDADENAAYDRPCSDNLVWHYTNLDAVEAILKFGTLRASHFAFLNDTTELSHGIDAVIRHAKALVAPAELTQITDELTHSYLSQYHVYVTCFSHNKDDLSQWRGYAPPPRGVAVVFEPSELARAARELHGPIESFGCIYADEQKIYPEIRKEVLDAYTRMQQGHSKIEEENAAPPAEYAPPMANDHSAVRMGFIVEMLELAARIKHDRFDAESELRFLTRTYGAFGSVGTVWPTGFHRASSFWVPNIDWTFRLQSKAEANETDHMKSQRALPHGLRGVVIGPSPHPDESLLSMRLLLSHFGFRNAEVARSRVPFRSW